MIERDGQKVLSLGALQERQSRGCALRKTMMLWILIYQQVAKVDSTLFCVKRVLADTLGQGKGIHPVEIGNADKAHRQPMAQRLHHTVCLRMLQVKLTKYHRPEPALAMQAFLGCNDNTIRTLFTLIKSKQFEQV